jgi:hypothetical protein
MIQCSFCHNKAIGGCSIEKCVKYFCEIHHKESKVIITKNTTSIFDFA